jgi:mRNA interferase RelE/StbE
MQGFALGFHPKVQKDLSALPPDVAKRILEHILALSEQPFPAGVKKLQGVVDTYRIRIGDYRVIYAIDTKTKLIYVDYVSHRKDAYR